MQNLLPPHGGCLVNLMAVPDQREALRRVSIDFLSIDLEYRQICDLELLLNGGYSPLKGFMGRADYESVLKGMTLADGTFWPVPVTLDVDAKTAASLTTGSRIALRDLEGFMLAVLTVSDIWEVDKQAEAQAFYGTSNLAHPGVASLMQRACSHYVGGALVGVAQPVHYDYPSARFSPQRLRDFFVQRGWSRVAAFLAQRPVHRAEHDFTVGVAADNQANLLISPMMNAGTPDTPDYHNLMRCYQAVMPHYPAETTALVLLPLTRRAAGIRELLWHAIVYRNHGCTHIIIDQCNSEWAANQVEVKNGFSAHQKSVGVGLIVMPPMVYVEECDQHMPKEKVPSGRRGIDFSETELQHSLTAGLEIPHWFSYPEVIQALRKAHPARSQRGFTLFFTGLSGAGKSTIAKALVIKLLEMGGRKVTLLDGDLVRKHLSSELGFSKEHRDINVRRIGYVASEITRHGGIVICAPIAPYTATRRAVREMIEPLGGFFEIYISTAIEVCEGRDRKGLYAKARAGLIREFTGISDPYEAPENAEMELDTSMLSVDEAVQKILLRLERDGYTPQG